MPKVLFATPFLEVPTKHWVESLEASIPYVEEAGWEHGLTVEIGNPYVSGARANLLAKFVNDASYDRIFFIDYDLGWEPAALAKVLSVDSDVVCGDYRFKNDREEYMTKLMSNEHGTPLVRRDGCILAEVAPAGFMCIKREVLDRFAQSYPSLTYGTNNVHVDLFNHGAIDGIWWGEDYAFCYRWRKLGGEVWVAPDLNIDHHSKSVVYKGNLHEFLLRQPGGSNHKE